MCLRLSIGRNRGNEQVDKFSTVRRSKISTNSKQLRNKNNKILESVSNPAATRPPPFPERLVYSLWQHVSMGCEKFYIGQTVPEFERSNGTRMTIATKQYLFSILSAKRPVAKQ